MLFVAVWQSGRLAEGENQKRGDWRHIQGETSMAHTGMGRKQTERNREKQRGRRGGKEVPTKEDSRKRKEKIEGGGKMQRDHSDKEVQRTRAP